MAGRNGPGWQTGCWNSGSNWPTSPSAAIVPPPTSEAQLRFLRDEGVDLIVTTGGLGPTADDLTVATVANFCGRDLVLDETMEATIASIIATWMARFTDVDVEAVERPTASRRWFPTARPSSTRSAPHPVWWCPAIRR